MSDLISRQRRTICAWARTQLRRPLPRDERRAVLLIVQAAWQGRSIFARIPNTKPGAAGQPPAGTAFPAGKEHE